jgi:hypothetical protein
VIKFLVWARNHPYLYWGCALGLCILLFQFEDAMRDKMNENSATYAEEVCKEIKGTYAPLKGINFCVIEVK